MATNHQDIGRDLFDERRAVLRVGLPVLGVVLVLAALLGIAVYSDRANRAGALALSDDLIAALQQRIAVDVSAYLDPAARALELAHDLAGLTGTTDRRELAEAFAGDALRRVPQLANVNFADGDGNFMLVRRGDAGGLDTKLIHNAPPPRSVVWVRRDAAGREIGRDTDPADTYDPRTRPWYVGAVATDRIFWTGVYVFFSDRAPGITAALRAGSPGGRTVVVGVDIRLDALSRFLADMQIGRTGRAMIVDGSGELVAYPDPARMLRHDGDRLVPVRVDGLGDPVLRAAWDRFRVEGPGRRILDVEGRHIITAVAPLPLTGEAWSVMVVVPEDEFVGFVASNNRTALAMSLVVVGLCAVLAALLAVQGLRADRAARALLDRSRAITRQSEAFARLAAEARLFDASSGGLPESLTETLAEVTGARRAGVWQVMAGRTTVQCHDSFERESGGHVSGLELAMSEAPQFLAALLAGEAIDVPDAAADRRTAALHQVLMQELGTSALLAVPVRRGEAVAGAVVLEDADASEGTRSFARAVANMLAVRMAEAPQAAPAQATTQSAAAAPQGIRSFAAELAVRGLDPAELAAEVYPDVAVMVLRFTDAAGMARRPSLGKLPLADQIVCAMQEIADTFGLPYLKLVGEELIGAAGFGAADPTAAGRIADAVLTMRDSCLAMLEEADLPASFSVGMDCGIAIGSPVGREPRVFNLWGEAVRSAHAMAVSAAPGTIQVTEAAYRALRHDFLFSPRGSFYIPRVGAARIFVLAGRP